jgi:hypothetical protein
MKIFFVGLHNKPEKTPLDSSTISGQRIDRIIKELHFLKLECVKTNLFNSYLLPETIARLPLAATWQPRVGACGGDIVVLLGGIVHDCFIQQGFNVVKIDHPAKVMSNENVKKYVDGAVYQIQQMVLPY